MDEGTFEVAFHFPNTQILLDNVSESEVGYYQQRFMTKKPFYAKQGKKSFCINPDLMTFMEVKPQTFF